MFYDIVLVGAGPANVYAAYEAISKNSNLKILMIDKGKPLSDRNCPIDGNRIPTCIHCPSCSIMNGFGGCGSFSDFKFPITNDFGGTLWTKIGKDASLSLQKKVDRINCEILDNKIKETPLLWKTTPELKKICTQNSLHLMDAEIRHIGTDNGKVLMAELYEFLRANGVNFIFGEDVNFIDKNNDTFDLRVGSEHISASKVVVAVGRSGAHWLGDLCKKHQIPTKANRVDIGVRVELPAEVFSDITDKVYESKIVYTTHKYQDKVRTFCMNPYGFVVNENTNGIVTVNGHSNSEGGEKSKNTNFALLVSQHFTDPFNNSNDYGESIVKLSNMLGGGVIVQRLGDLERGQRSTKERIDRSTVIPTLKACPGDLSLVLPKRILDDIIEMLHALDKVAPGTANDDTLLYGVEVKFYNMEVEVDDKLKVPFIDGLYIIGDGSGVTHSLSQAAASGIYVMDDILGGQIE